MGDGKLLRLLVHKGVLGYNLQKHLKNQSSCDIMPSLNAYVGGVEREMKTSSGHIHWVGIVVALLIAALVCTSGYFLFTSIRSDVSYAQPTPTPVMQPTLNPQPTLPAPTVTPTPGVSASPSASPSPTA